MTQWGILHLSLTSESVPSAERRHGASASVPSAERRHGASASVPSAERRHGVGNGYSRNK